MSLAETYSAATASIVVSPATTDTSCIGPQLVGVIAPEKVPCPAALAAPPTARTTTAIATTAGRIVRTGRAFTSPCSFVRRKKPAHSTRDITDSKPAQNGKVLPNSETD